MHRYVQCMHSMHRYVQCMHSMHRYVQCMHSMHRYVQYPARRMTALFDLSAVTLRCSAHSSHFSLLPAHSSSLSCSLCSPPAHSTPSPAHSVPLLLTLLPLLFTLLSFLLTLLPSCSFCSPSCSLCSPSCSLIVPFLLTLLPSGSLCSPPPAHSASLSCSLCFPSCSLCSPSCSLCFPSCSLCFPFCSLCFPYCSLFFPLLVHVNSAQPREIHDHQPLSLGHVSSASMDNVFEALLRPSRPRPEPHTADLQNIINDLKAENAHLKGELQEARDQADLLEFRVLELTEASDRFSESGKSGNDRDLTEEPTGHAAVSDDLSLPLSIDSGLDLTADGKKTRLSGPGKNTSGPASPGSSSSSVVSPTGSRPSNSPDPENKQMSASLQSSSVQSSLSSKPAIKANNVSVEMEETSTSKFEDAEAEVERLQEVVANLDHYLASPEQLEAALLQAMEKLRAMDASIQNLEVRVSSLSGENRYLSDALSALSDSHETRTEASGTESEMVSRKTPSLHSDLSDSESDSSATDSRPTKKRLEVTSSFQESGIFDGTCDVTHAATQTETGPEVRLMMVYDEKCELEEAENDARLMVQRLDSQLTAAREMELLLSASLSQEQEISRDLQDKVREQQVSEKERCLRMVMMERDNFNLNMDDRVVSLVLDKDSYASQLLFVKHSLILLQVFRHFQLHNTNMSIDVDGHRTPDGGLDGLDEVLPSRLDKLEDHMDLDTLGDSDCSGEDINDSCDLIIANEDPDVHGSSERGDLIDSAIDEALMHISSTGSQELDFSSSFLSLDEMIGSPKFPDFLVPGLVDVSVQTEPEVQRNQVPFTNIENTLLLTPNLPYESNSSESSNHHDDIERQPENHSSHSDFSAPKVSLTSQGSQTAAVQKPLVQNKGTMTVQKDLLSQREDLYLGQIETLQQEKIALRKECEQERSTSLHACRALQEALQEAQEQARAGERARAELQCELDELSEQRDAATVQLNKRIQQLTADLARSSDVHEAEKAALRRDYDARVAEVAAERRRYAERSAQLERNLRDLRTELQVVGVAMVADMTGFEGRPHDANSAAIKADMEDGGQQEADHDGQSSDMMDKIRRLVKSEAAARAKIIELEKKESAYRQTIQEADAIMQRHVAVYTTRIDELEASHDLCQARLAQLTASEARCRSTLKNSCRSEQDARVSELIEQLLNTEKSGLELKDKLWRLEKNEKELKIRLLESEKAQEALKGELLEQEELILKMQALQVENCAITEQLQQAHEGVRRTVDLQQTQRLLKARVEELEASEQSLRESLDRSCASWVLKERKFKEQLSALEEEVSALRSQLETSAADASEARATEVALKRQLEEVKCQLVEVRRELSCSSADETNNRAEVSRTRAQLRQAQAALTDAEALNCGLRERLAAAEALKEALERALDERKRRHESDLLALNLQASQRECRLEETEGQLCELTQLHAARELDLLASSPVEPAIRATYRLLAKLTVCAECAQLHGAVVRELRAQVDALSDLLNGNNDDDSDDEDDGGNIERTTDGEPETCAAVACEPDVSTCTLPNQELVPDEACIATPPGSENPGPVPAPRRKRKLKRAEFSSSLRSSLRSRKQGGGSTILEELEEKVRELEDSVSRKEEELRIADGEATELSNKLQHTQQLALSKDAELALVRRALTELQQQLLRSLEANEANNTELQSSFKERVDAVVARGRLKDRIIATLVMQIRAVLRTSNMSVAVKQLRQIDDNAALRRQRKTMLQKLGITNGDVASNVAPDDDDDEIVDYDVESVCDAMMRPHEMVFGSLMLIRESLLSVNGELLLDKCSQTVERDFLRPIMTHQETQTTSEHTSHFPVQVSEQFSDVRTLDLIPRCELDIIESEIVEPVVCAVKSPQDNDPSLNDQNSKINNDFVADVSSSPAFEGVKSVSCSVNQALNGNVFAQDSHKVIQEPYCNFNTEVTSEIFENEEGSSIVIRVHTDRDEVPQVKEPLHPVPPIPSIHMYTQTTQTCFRRIGPARQSFIPRPTARTTITCAPNSTDVLTPSISVHNSPTANTSVGKKVSPLPTEKKVPNIQSYPPCNVSSAQSSCSEVSQSQSSCTTVSLAQSSSSEVSQSQSSCTTVSLAQSSCSTVSLSQSSCSTVSLPQPSCFTVSSAQSSCPTVSLSQSSIRQKVSHAPSIPAPKLSLAPSGLACKPASTARGGIAWSKRGHPATSCDASGRCSKVPSHVTHKPNAVSDARCIRRMLTDVAPPRARVNCIAAGELDPTAAESASNSESLPSQHSLHTFDKKSSSDAHSSVRNARSNSLSCSRGQVPSSPPKWRPAGSTSTDPPALLSSSCKVDGSGCIPKPEDLRVTRHVGKDGVVIAWNPLDHDCVAGFQVVVGGQVVQFIKSPHRTKALITGLPISPTITIGLVSVGVDGRCSKPAVVACDRSQLSSRRIVRKSSSSRRTVGPTAI
ncbi:uncharacterized protein LOC108669665 [Hyalella azteca]|uniref:Uncharacterized protein LOC108669665 n=1 Tax=Hyalella azteca TaxID=294128 RepID=A0A8B7NGM3_HYAAZ|nr:uncharacterized protein LOC108669665 [Hyalella azteca]